MISLSNVVTISSCVLISYSILFYPLLLQKSLDWQYPFIHPHVTSRFPFPPSNSRIITFSFQKPVHSLSRLSTSFFLYYTIPSPLTFLLFTRLPVICWKIVGRYERRNKKGAEIVLTRNKKKKELAGNPSRKGGFSTTKGVYALFAMFVAELCTHEATRGRRAPCFIGHLRRVRPTLCRRARGTRVGKSYDCRETPRARRGGEGGGGRGGGGGY